MKKDDGSKQNKLDKIRKEWWTEIDKKLKAAEAKKIIPPLPTSICMDCSFHNAYPIPDPMPTGYVCPHWRPEYWQELGYERNWGDAAIMAWPWLEVLRKETDEKVEYVILAPLILRRPAEYYFDKITKDSWGSY